MQWVATEVVMSDSTKSRAAVIRQFVAIAEKLKMVNYHVVYIFYFGVYPCCAYDIAEQFRWSEVCIMWSANSCCSPLDQNLGCKFYFIFDDKNQFTSHQILIFPL